MAKRDFTAGDVVDMSASINEYFEQIGKIFKQEVTPASNSQALQEELAFQDAELVRDVYYRGFQSMESAADHMVAFADLLVSPAKTVAPWTCVRGSLESSAIAAWFLDPKIDGRVRVARCYAFRYEGFVQQIKQAQAKDSQSEVQMAKNRMEVVAKRSIQLGYPPLTGKEGISGIGQRWPGITELVRTTLDKESDYRLMSAVAHGHHWATHQTSFRMVERPNSEGRLIKGLEKHVHPDFMVYLGNVTVTSFARVLWYLWKTYGWDLNELYEVLETTYQKLHYNPQSRFWRS